MSVPARFEPDTRQCVVGVRFVGACCARCDTLDRDDDAVDEPGQAGQPGAICQPLECDWQVGSGLSIGQALAQLARQLSLR
jgi:hypothetical protein